MNKKSGEIVIFGKHVVSEALQHSPQIIKKIFILESVKQSGLEEVRHRAKSFNIPVNNLGKKDFIHYAPEEVNHQGVVAFIKEFPYADFNSWMETIRKQTNPLVLILGEVQDPHNVGAIIRSAAAFGVAGIIMPSHRQAPITSSVFKASAGAVFTVPIIRVGNVNQVIEELKKEKFWIATLEKDAPQPINTFEFDTPTAIVIGNEGEGVREHTRVLADFALSIPIHDSVESLNASVSAAIACFVWSQSHK